MGGKSRVRFLYSRVAQSRFPEPGKLEINSSSVANHTRLAPKLDRAMSKLILWLPGITPMTSVPSTRSITTLAISFPGTCCLAAISCEV